MNKIIAVKNLCYEYQTNEVLHRVAFDIERGDFVALVGENGSGKTTLIKIILGLLQPKHGTVKLFNQDIKAFTTWAKIGYLPQSLQIANRQFPATVKEIISEGLISSKKFIKRQTGADKIIIADIIEQLNLTSIQKKAINELSGGQWQRVLLARALVNAPELLILDEPSNALDALSREQFFTYIQKLNHERKTTIILITHDVGTVGNFANKLLYIDKTVQFYGDFADFCQSPKMQAKFGSSSQHLICHQHH